jgi:GTP diphosphokinase / guanosine-3',5'-bis(diphosphate) 3'-diphosphatase
MKKQELADIQKSKILYKELLSSCNYIMERSQRILLKNAFVEVLQHFGDARNTEGEFQLAHAVSVARITADDMGLDATSIISALVQQLPLSTTVEADAFKMKFGNDTLNIVRKLQQISGIRMDKISIMPENFIQLLLSISGDIRVLLIKLADRINLMRNIDLLSTDQQKQISTETYNLYSPLAHRLGLYKVKGELDDLAMQHTMPEVYRSIRKKIQDTTLEQKKYFEEFIIPIEKSLRAAGLDFEIKARTKAIPSIYLKMKKQEIEFDEVFDFFAIRIIIKSAPENEKAECWKAYSHVTDIYPPNTSRLRDWISAPRPNGYESLHVTVEAPGNKWVEVQIRTRRMDEHAEKGMAAHWRYKEQKGTKSSSDEWLRNIRSMLENYSPGDDEIALSAGMKVHSDHIFVFTPEGHLKKLHTGATVLDFAFDIHTEVGQHCNGAKVNKLFVPLKHVLKTGDHVEVITSKNQKPNIDWLNWVTSSKAITKIKRILKDAEFSQSETGKDLLMRKLGQLKIDYNDDIGNKLVTYFKAASALDLFHGLAEGKYDIQKVKEAFQPVLKTEEARPPIKPFTKIDTSQNRSGKHKPLVIINDTTPLADVKFARCCQPVFGDEIFGFVTVSEGIKIHRTTCTNAAEMLERYHYRVVQARWAEVSELTSYVATIRLSGNDQPGILNDITNIVSGELKADIRSINLNSHNGKFDGSIMVNVNGQAHLSLILGKLVRLKGIRKVSREN